MQLTVIVRTLGVLFMLFSTTLLPPLAVSVWYADGEATHFGVMFSAALAVGLALWVPLRRRPDAIRTRDGFAIVALMWTAMTLLGAVPFVLGLDMSIVDALFESASGYTTTGASVIVGLDALPRSILLYRQELQWLGGIGVVVLAVALLPMLRVGGMQLYRAEMPGPFKDERMTPRIGRTARSLSVVYVALTAACALCFWLAGMEPFDAIGHSLSTLSTGGFSTHDASLAYFDSPAVETVATLFSLIGGINFSVHFIAWRALALDAYARDSQTRAFLLIVATLIAVVALVLNVEGVYEDPLEALRYASFEVVTVITTTGFSIADFSAWPLALPALLIFSSFIGGSAGSTSGGIKVVRILVLSKQAAVHVGRLIHPRAVQPIRLDGRVVADSVIDGIWGFFAVYVGVFVVLMTVLMMDGIDQVTAFGGLATCLNNTGPGLGAVATTFLGVSDLSTLLFTFAMLLGRLEIFTLLVLLTPAFWKH